MTKIATDVCMSFSFHMVAVYGISLIYFEALNSTNLWDLLCTLEVTTKKLHCNLQLARVDIIKSQKWVVLDSSTWHLSSSKIPALVFFKSGVPGYNLPYQRGLCNFSKLSRKHLAYATFELNLAKNCRWHLSSSKTPALVFLESSVPEYSLS